MEIKVLMVGNHPSVKGGITSVISQLLGYDWSADSVRMKFIPTYIETDNIKKIMYFMGAYLNIRREIHMDRPDIVHIHMSYRGSFQRKYAIHKLCKKCGIPDVIHLHGSEFKKWYDESDEKTKIKIRKMLKESSAFIVLGEKWNKIVKEIEANTNTIVVNNAIHISKKKAAWNDEKFQVLFLGILIRRKGVDVLLKAVKLLKDKNRLGKLNFVIAGNGAEEERLNKLAADLDIKEIVEFVGWISGEEKERLLLDSQALVLPSYNEGMPVAILEAVSHGMPVIATDVGDISSVVKNGENGYLIQPGDIDQLAESIVKISNDKELYLKMSEYSNMTGTKNFSDINYFKQIITCYNAVIQGV